MPPGIFEGSPWLGDTVEFTRMPLNNIPRIPTQILLRFERVDAIVTSCRTSPAVLRRAPKSSCPTAQRSAPSPMASFLSILADRDREVGKLGHPRSFEQRIFARSTRARNENVLIDNGKPILGGLRFALGPFDQQRFCGSSCGAPHRRGVHPHAGKARAQPNGCALRTPGTDAGAGRSWNRSSHLSAPHRLADLFKHDLPFGLERDRLGNKRLLATGRVFGPLLRQIRPVGDRQAGMMIGRSTMSLPPGNWLACQAARNTDGARQPSGNRAWKKRRIFENPGLDRSVPLHRRYSHLAHFGQHGSSDHGALATKWSILMLHRSLGWRRHGAHWLHAPAAPRDQKPRAAIPQRSRPVRGTDHLRKFFHGCRKS